MSIYIKSQTEEITSKHTRNKVTDMYQLDNVYKARSKNLKNHNDYYPHMEKT